ncbi:DUF2914 domain-containing protein [Bizionia gelidisalsuginis]|uniref:DUF2914 domain-containing protein n=2 Tax=Bizionia TaxID=283785 RepID=A0A8H2QKI8_9FLAO|nr:MULTISPECIES: DUF2914 domain-containing protein [Bizionia]TYB80135.1 DUF2914 domain-containing protein [Bizionia saleffrena]TYC16980.1 DUF2914 domain-containing protein [Bizionia gelidisalsuginis]
MNSAIERFKNSRFRNAIQKYQKYLLICFFVGGFIFDSLTLGRIDRIYDLVVLCLHMTSLTVTLYLYNLMDDGKWKNTFLERYQIYFSLAIQFFFGGLSSAYVIYFSRSVSLSKTITFFIILLALLLANELLKKRISNKYLQFSVYFFLSFTFFAFMIPVFIKKMNTPVFIYSGLVSLAVTLLLITFIYRKSPSTRAEIRIVKLFSIILVIYVTINTFYFTNLIPPVPLALDAGMVAHNVQKQNNSYLVTYERDEWYIFWRDHRLEFIYEPGERVYIFTSIFAPTEIKKSIFHRWKWFNKNTNNWELVDNISYKITGGRDAGFRGYTYKNNVKPGLWKVDVTTKEGLILGVIDFEIIIDTNLKPKKRIQRRF